LKQYQLFLIDLDGTMYRGSDKIEEAPVFINHLQEIQQDYMFLTNNSSKKPSDVVAHLASFGIVTEESKVYTTSLATAQYISNQKPGASVYVIGEEGLEAALEAAGCRLITGDQNLVDCDFVVIGLDRQITYEKLAHAALAVRAGATFISTNADKALPTERGLLPGNGSLTSVITTTTKEKPLFIGKPEPLMIDLILQQTGLQKKDLLMIGDNYETDILAGIGAGIDTAIVFTGYTSKEELEGVTVKPTYQWNTLLEAINS
jgi:4-nitrophenyl phosphatase